MKEFFKFVFASMIGVILSFFVIILLLIIVATAVVSSAGSDNKAELTKNTVLHLTLNKTVTERSDKSPFSDFNFMGFNSDKSIGLNDILANIRNAKNNDNIKGIYLDLSSIPAGFASTEEIRNALIDFKSSKKFILAYSEVYTQSAYYLASVADKIYLNPEGILDFRGLSSETTFVKGALDKLGIEAQVIKVGTYKSAVEPFILEKMSEANRRQVTSFLGSLYNHMLVEVSKSRKIPKDSLFSIANNARLRNAQDALTFKMIDGIKYKDEVIAELKTLSGTDVKKDIKTVNIADYPLSEKDEASGTSSNRIAMIYANGEITSGEGSDEVMGSERISRAIRKARTDDKVKAIVLRVNSPGGSALASDVIWREVVLTKKVKPIVVSMGDVAASGGYYIACAADSIYAQPNTITGSIGVFGIIPNMKNFFNDKLGITFDNVKTGQFADLGSVNRPLTEAERLIIQNEVNKIYFSFTQKVATGRKKSQSYIDSIGQGRVWTGSEALKIGLVDKLGNINDAIKSAARKAKLENYKIVEYPSQIDPLQSLFNDTGDKVRIYFTKQELGENYTYYQQIKAALNLAGIQARLPYNFNIK